jgi:L-rhamnose isomerase/sugar isomerase
MQIEKYKIDQFNQDNLQQHKRRFENASSEIKDVEGILQKLIDFQIAIPSWALGTGGTRFGRFAGGGEPRSLEEKIEDIGLLHKLNNSSGAISLHIPWDIPSNANNIKALAAQNGLRFDAMNSNTFQGRVGKGISAQASHKTVLEILTSHGFSHSV